MKDDTKLVHLGRGQPKHEGTVNLPVYRASTILSPDVESYVHRFDADKRYRGVTYGASGTHNARALADVVSALEGAAGTVVTASGLSAICMTLGALLGNGDHVLVTDSVYGPTRKYCTEVLARYGVETTFYEPGVGAGIEALFRDHTRLVFLEAPGSLTFEMQDVPAMVAAAKARGLTTVMDNTWATPLFFKPLAHGVDVSVQAGTKYFAGHSDLVIGLAAAAEESTFRRIADHARVHGDVAGPDDCYLTLRGLRTLSVRLARQQVSALEVASWLASRPEVARVLYPPLPEDPGHALWKRDFGGAASLFGLVLASADTAAMKRFVDGLELFHIGSSWGGYESLVAFNYTPLDRELLRWSETPALLRLHIGLEDPGDLIADLETSFARL